MSDTLGVKITADVVDLQTKLAVAKAEMAGFSRTLNTAAKTVASSGLTDALGTQMTTAATSLIQVRSRVDELSGSLAKAGVHVSGIREIGFALHELASGNVGMLPFSLARVAETTAGLSIAGIGAVAGVAALGAALYELGKNAIESADELRSLQDQASFQGFDIADAEMKQLQSDLGASAGKMLELRDATTQMRAAIAAAAPELARGFNISEDQAVAKLVSTLKDLEKEGPKLLDSLGASTKTLQDFTAAAAEGNRARELALVFEQIDASAKKMAPAQRGYWENVELGLASLGGGAEQAAKAFDDLDAAAVKAREDALQASGTSMTTTPIVAPKTDQLADFRQQLDKMEAEFKGSHDAMLQDAVRMWQGETQAAGLSTQQQREAWTGLYEAEKQLNAERTQSATEAARKKTEEEKQALQEITTIQRDQADTELQLGKIKIEGERDNLQAEVDAGKMTAAQKLQTIKDLDDQEYELEHSTLQTELDDLDGHLANYKQLYQQLYDKLEVLDVQHVQKMAADDLLIAADAKKAADNSAKGWQNAENLINRDMDQMLSGVLRGTQSWQQATVRLFDNFAVSAIENIAKVGVDFAAGEAKKLAAALFTDQAMTDAQIAQIAAGNIANKAGDKETILEDAKVSAANVYKWVSAIPYVGPFLAPEAAAAAFAAVAAFGSFDQGTNLVPTDMLALVHAGERIVPAADNVALINGLNGGQGGGGGDTYVTLNVSAVDGQSVANLFKANGSVIANVIAQQIRNGNRMGTDR